MSESYFGYGTTLAGIVNVESVIGTPPGIEMRQGGSPMPLTGGVGRRLLSKRLKRGGDANAAWVFGAFDGGMSELNTLRLSMFGSLTTVSKRLYVITPDESGEWSPFLVDVHCAYIGQTMNQFNQPYDVRFDLVGGVLQYVNKATNFNLAVSEHLVNVDASGGNVTATLPALSGVTADVPYRFVLTSANSLILDGASSETVDGNATKTVTGANTSVTIIKSGSAWLSI